MVEVLKFAKSTSDARRLIAQGAVKVDGQVIQDVNFQFDGRNHGIVEVGKNRIAQVQKDALKNSQLILTISELLPITSFRSSRATCPVFEN